MCLKLPVAVVATLILGSPAMAGPNACDSVGRIESFMNLKPGDVSLEHNGKPQPARRFDDLYPGDVIQMNSQGDGFVKITTIDHPTGFYVRRASRPHTVTGPCEQANAMPPGPGKIIEALLHRPIGALAVLDTMARASSPPPAYDPLLIGGPQYLPTGQRHAAFVWASAPTTLTVRDARRQSLGAYDSQGGLIALDLPASAQALTVSSPGGELAWTVVTAPEPIRPAWLTPPEAQLSEDERIARAVWILSEGPMEWRVFALGEIETLSKSHFSALLVWRAIAAGEFGQISAAN